jgi:histidine triad (HIT) family protein
MEKFKILFVCSGNTFRSASADHALRRAMKGIKDISISSAGTRARGTHVDPPVDKSLRRLGYDPSSHISRKITKKIATDADLIIAMAKEHQDFIKENYGIYSPLFNEIALDKNTSIPDVEEVVDPSDKKAVYSYVDKTVRYICKNIPKLKRHICDSELLFFRFANGHKTHRNGFPFIPLHETAHSIAFMSIDIPQKEDGHILVIPKKRYTNLDIITQKVLSDLIRTVSIVGKALMQTHQGYNVLLNNGRSAGQFVFHTHFHVVPRDSDDDIRIEVWKRRKLSKKDFLDINKNISKCIKRSLR